MCKTNIFPELFDCFLYFSIIFIFLSIQLKIVENWKKGVRKILVDELICLYIHREQNYKFLRFFMRYIILAKFQIIPFKFGQSSIQSSKF